MAKENNNHGAKQASWDGFSSTFRRFDITYSDQLERTPFPIIVPNRSHLHPIDRIILVLLLGMGVIQMLPDINDPKSIERPGAIGINQNDSDQNDIDLQPHSRLIVPPDAPKFVPNGNDVVIIGNLEAGNEGNTPIISQAIASESYNHSIHLPLISSGDSPESRLRSALAEIGISFGTFENNATDSPDARGELAKTIFSAEQLASGIQQARIIFQKLGIGVPLTDKAGNLIFNLEEEACSARVGPDNRVQYWPKGDGNNPDALTAELLELLERCEFAEFFHLVQKRMKFSETEFSNPYTSEGMSTLLELLLSYSALSVDTPAMTKPSIENVRGLLDFVLATAKTYRPQIRYRADGEPYPSVFFDGTYLLLLNLTYLLEETDENYDSNAYQTLVEQTSLLLTVNGLEAVAESTNWFRDFLIYLAIVQNPKAVDNIDSILDEYPEIHSAIKAALKKGLIFDSNSYARAIEQLSDGDTVDAKMTQWGNWVHISPLKGTYDSESGKIVSRILTEKFDLALEVDIGPVIGANHRIFTGLTIKSEDVIQLTTGMYFQVPPKLDFDGREIDLFSSDLFSIITARDPESGKIIRFHLDTK